MKKLEALKSLYAALGGTASTVAGCTTSLEVLNAILAIGEEDPEAFIADAIAAIAENAESILPQAELIEKTITANGEYAASADDADGYSSVNVNVPAPTPTGFSDVTITEINPYALVYYEDSDPTAIKCTRTGSQSVPSGCTAVGWITGSF